MSDRLENDNAKLVDELTNTARQFVSVERSQPGVLKIHASIFSVQDGERIITMDYRSSVSSRLKKELDRTMQLVRALAANLRTLRGAGSDSLSDSLRGTRVLVTAERLNDDGPGTTIDVLLDSNLSEVPEETETT